MGSGPEGSMTSTPSRSHWPSMRRTQKRSSTSYVVPSMVYDSVTWKIA